ncbi:MAG: hypothetical protein COB85_06565 [Bacteroidetes bacterium]|nr:MAG: hypothetical protein COB85_06565 [Bacteroidota bacterium]
MKRIVLLFVFCGFYSLSAYAQPVNVVQVYNVLEKFSTPLDFMIVQKDIASMESSRLVQLKSFCRNDKESNLYDLYNRFKLEAFKVGANCFVIDSSYQADSGKTVVVISVYKLRDQVIVLNQEKMNENNIYVLGNLRIKKEKGRNVKVSGETLNIKPLQVKVFTIENGEKFKMKVGGGLVYRFVGYKNMAPKHVCLGGVSLDPTMTYDYSNGGPPVPHVQSNSAKMQLLDFDFGQFYVEVMQSKSDSTR